MTEMTSTNSGTVIESTEEPQQQEDYFGFQVTHRYYFPDGVTWMDFKSMNEGTKRVFQKKTSRDLVLQRSTGEAKMRVDPGTERYELIILSVTGWNLLRRGALIHFTDKALRDFMELADPKIIEGLESAIRRANPWLMDEMTVKEIDVEIENLNELRALAVEREQGEGS